MLSFLFPNHSNFPPTHFGTILSVLHLSVHLNFASLKFLDTQLLLMLVAASAY